MTIHQFPNFGSARKKESNYRATAGQLIRVDPPPQIVHDHFDVELVVVHLTARPSHPPFAKTKNNWLQFFAGSSGMIFDSPLVRHRLPHDEAGLFKLVETLGQQRGRDLR